MMNLNRKSIFLLSIILGLILTSYISYGYSKKVILRDLVKSGSVYMNRREYGKAIAIYQEVVKYTKDDNAKNMLNLALTMEESRKAYHDGLAFYNQKNYLEALKLFKQVMRNDTIRYDKAQKKIKECTDKYVEYNLNSAQKCLNDLDYDVANKYLDNILRIDNNNEVAKILKDKISKNKIQ